MKFEFFIPTSSYKEAIERKDTTVLKGLLSSILGSDPTFETSEFSEAMTYIKNESAVSFGAPLELEEEYMIQEGEYTESDPKKFTPEYYALNLVWLQDNFALDRRLPHIKEVGKIAYKDKKTLGKTKRSQKESIKKDYAVPPTTSGQKKQWLQGIIDFFKSIIELVKGNWKLLLGIIGCLVIVFCFIQFFIKK